MPGYSLIGRVATLASSSVTWPEKPGSMNPAVECVIRPSRPSDDLPSSRAATSSGSVTSSYVEPSTNSPGCRTNASSAPTSTSRVRSDWSAAGSMCGYLWLSKTRKNLSSRTSMLDGWIISRRQRVEPYATAVELGEDVAVGEKHGENVTYASVARCPSDHRRDATAAASDQTRQRQPGGHVRPVQQRVHVGLSAHARQHVRDRERERAPHEEGHRGDRAMLLREPPCAATTPSTTTRGASTASWSTTTPASQSAADANRSASSSLSSHAPQRHRAHAESTDDAAAPPSRRHLQAVDPLRLEHARTVRGDDPARIAVVEVERLTVELERQEGARVGGEVGGQLR